MPQTYTLILKGFKSVQDLEDFIVDFVDTDYVSGSHEPDDEHGAIEYYMPDEG